MVDYHPHPKIGESLKDHKWHSLRMSQWHPRKWVVNYQTGTFIKISQPTWVGRRGDVRNGGMMKMTKSSKERITPRKEGADRKKWRITSKKLINIFTHLIKTLKRISNPPRLASSAGRVVKTIKKIIKLENLKAENFDHLQLQIQPLDPLIIDIV
jgi:hypothetical protein